MRIMKNMQNFLQDQDFYIDIFGNNLHVYLYQKLISLNDKKVELELESFNLIIEGDNLSIKSMDKKEILIEGFVFSVRFER